MGEGEGAGAEMIDKFFISPFHRSIRNVLRQCGRDGIATAR